MHSRRSFLRAVGALAAGTVLTPETVLADPYRIVRSAERFRARPVRIRGRVTGGGRGLGGVRLSDGFDVVRTASDGRFELVSHAERPFVSLSTPRGFSIPTGTPGTAAAHLPIRADASGEMSAAFDLTPLDRDDTRHAALLLPDIQTEYDWEMQRFHDESVPDLIDTVGRLDRETFGIACGDIMFDDLSMYPDYEAGIQRTGVPFFQCVGNHDLDFDGGTDEATTATFSSRYGPRYYSFDRGAVHYVVLDDVLWHGSGYIGYLGYEQMHWLAADLATLEPGAPVIVALHIPVLGSRYRREGEERPGVSVSVTNRDYLYRLLEPFDAHVIAGHTHENDHNWENGVHEHVSGTVCGAWWSGDICGDGTPNGYSIYEVDGSDIRWRYKAVGQPDDHQLRVHPRGANPGAPDEFCANVWDADDEWTVVWYENGERRGLMSRRLGLDPRCVTEQAGPDLPAHRSWVDPYPTWHMYWAPVAAGHGPITVEATDRFGRVYTGEMP